MAALGFLWQPFVAFAHNRWLIAELAKREVLGRYRGATFGMLWSLVGPIMMLAIYTLAFGYILKSRWPGASGSTQDFVLILFCGLIVHGFFAECLTQSPRLIVANPNYVKKVVFPVDALIWSMTLAAAFHFAMNLLVLIAMKLALHGELPWTTVLLPLVFLPLYLLSVATGLLVSAVGVYVRDIGQLAGVLATAMLFLSSAIVPVQSVPGPYRWVFEWNPLTAIIDQARQVVIWGSVPDWALLGGLTLSYTLLLILASAAFHKMRRGFSDVI